MKKGLISVALSTAVLAGGLLGAAPANAATPVNYDAKIKTIENKIQVEKWKVYGSTTNHATASDKQAYNLFIDSMKKRSHAYELECSARGVEKFFVVVNKTKNSGKLSSAAQKHYNNIAAKSLKDAKDRFKKSENLFKESSISSYKSYTAERAGKSFKYKRAAMQSYYKTYNYTQSKCDLQMSSSVALYTMVYSSPSASANNKYFTNADRNKLNNESLSLRNKSKASIPSEKTSAKKNAERATAYDKSIKSKITSLEKELSSAKSSKAKSKK